MLQGSSTISEVAGSSRFSKMLPLSLDRWAANPTSGGWTDLVKLERSGPMSSLTVRRHLQTMLFIQLTCAERTSSAAAGKKTTDSPGSEGFVRGDFEDMRQLVFEYLASDVGSDLRRAYGPYPVLTILVKAYSYLIARYDLDGLRIDTAKYVSATQLEWFGNAMREFGHSIGKRNIFTFGEIWDKEETIANFVGCNSTEVGSFGIDSALDFPLFYQLPGIAKALAPVEDLRS